MIIVYKKKIKIYKQKNNSGLVRMMFFFYFKEAFPQIINYKKAFNLLETQKHPSNFKIMILIIKINACYYKCI